MSNALKKIGVLTSGGDAPGMNAALRAVVRTCVYHKRIPFGIRHGYDGLIKDDIHRMNAGSVKHIIHLGGTILKSARSREFKTREGMQQAYENLSKKGIEGLVVIGGDGTFRGALEFANAFKLPIIGIPGTIDNDIFGTDFTVGFDTACNTVVEAVDKIRDTATSHNRVFFIEVMGRDAGFIAINSGIAAGSEEVLIPEKDRGIEQLIESLERSSRRNKTSRLVIVAEGDRNGTIFELEQRVKERLGEQYETKVTVLGHTQRGGRPSCADRVLASRLGVHAVEGLLEGEDSVMAGVHNGELTFTPFDKAIKRHPKMDKELLRVADIISI